jgi:hypothetical protein
VRAVVPGEVLLLSGDRAGIKRAWITMGAGVPGGI